jgi:hypothetical protein
MCVLQLSSNYARGGPKIRTVYIISRINFNLVPVFTTTTTPPPPQRTMTDRRGAVFYDKSGDPRVNRTDSGDQPQQNEWIRKPMSSPSKANGLVIGEKICDPFICSLVDDEGRPCQGQFSGVINFPYPSPVPQLICRSNASVASPNTFLSSIKIFSPEFSIPSTGEGDISPPPSP